MPKIKKELLLGFIVLLGGCGDFPPPAPSSYQPQASPPPAVAPTYSRDAGPTPVTVRKEPIEQPKRTRSNSSSGRYQESEAEKLYEKMTGKEVVHRKDGSTYERKQRSKKK